MDLVKIGKFIAKIRKEKDITQEQLGKMVNASFQTVSKWERGLNLPNASLMLDLCKILGITTDELLLGEKIKKTDDKSLDIDIEKGQVIIDGIKYYEKKAKNKFHKILLVISIIFISVIGVLLAMYYMTYYNQIKIYDIYSASNNFDLKGRIIFNPDNRIITINDLRYNDNYIGTDKEIKAKAVELELTLNDTIIFKTGDLSYFSANEALKLNDYLEKIKIDISSQPLDDHMVKENDLDNFIIKITYIDINNESQTIEVSLNFEKTFSNNKFVSY